MANTPRLVDSITTADSQTQRICGMSGLTRAALEHRIRNLNELLASLKKSIAEAEAAERDERFYGRAVAVSSIIVAGCDLFMELVSVPPTPLSKAVKAVYGQKATLAEASVGRVDAAKATTRLVNGVSGAVGGAQKVLVKQGTSVADLAVDADRQQLTTLKVAQFWLAKNAELLEYGFKAEGKTKAATVVKQFAAVAKAGGQVIAAFEAGTSSSGIASARKTAISLSHRLQAQLAQLNADLQSCDELVPLRLG